MFRRSCTRQNTSKQPRGRHLGRCVLGPPREALSSVDSAAFDFIITLDMEAFQPFAGSAGLMTSQISFLKRPWILLGGFIRHRAPAVVPGPADSRACCGATDGPASRSNPRTW